MNRILLASGAGLALLLGACAEERPAASTNRIFFIDTQGKAATCTVPRDVRLNRENVTEVAMTVGNDGGWCGVSVAQDGKPYATGGVSARATHGRVLVRNVGDVTRVDYFPDRGFTGQDSFIVALVPLRQPGGQPEGHRMKVNVTVQPGPASAATPAAAPARR